MKRFLKTYGYGIYMGIALPMFANIHLPDWQWWAIFIPIMILVNWNATK